MLYEEARVYLEHVSKYGSVLGLESIRELLSELNNPQEHLKFIHIAGTNGKGSILSYVSNILIQAGYRTGAYISPTILDYLERFQINGQYMSKEDFAEITEKVKVAAERMVQRGKSSPTVFEIETAISFVFFAKYDCDFVVLETGLGGALDATNVIDNKIACVFASISRDHMAVLGNSLEEIAETKAGIMRECVQVISGTQKPEVLQVLKKIARDKGCDFYVAEPHTAEVKKSDLDGQVFSYKGLDDIEIQLLGKHQIENAATAIETVMALRREGVFISDRAIYGGMEKTKWPGRFEVLKKEPYIIVDGAHNADAAKRLAENVSTYLNNKKITAVMGVFKDKEYQKIVETLAPYLDKAYTVDLPDKERTLSKEELKSELEKNGVNAVIAESMTEAVKKAAENAKNEEAVLVFGSLSHLKEAIQYVRSEGEQK